MESRRRVQLALQHREPDRVPRDLGGTESSGMTAYAYRRLLDFLGIDEVPRVFEPYQYVAYIGAPVRRRYHIDTVNLTPEPRHWAARETLFGFAVELPENWRERREADGSTSALNSAGAVVAQRPAGGMYFDPVSPPLLAVTDGREIDCFRDSIWSFDWPAFADEAHGALRRRAARLHATGACVVLNLCCHLLAAGQLLRGFENFMVDMVCAKTLAHALLDSLVAGYSERVARLGPALRGYVDVVLLNDDLGTQGGPMLAPALYREMIKPRQAELFACVRHAFGKPILFHSCGAVRDFIPDLVEVGVDALNPVQVSAAGMNLDELKREFGPLLTFWGGGVDTQKLLNSGSPTQVKDAVKRSVQVLAPGGGFVFCQVHNIQPDVPPANVEAMYEALDETDG